MNIIVLSINDLGVLTVLSEGKNKRKDSLLIFTGNVNSLIEMTKIHRRRKHVEKHIFVDIENFMPNFNYKLCRIANPFPYI